MTVTPLPFRLRPFGQHDSEQDYQLLHALSNYQVPQDPVCIEYANDAAFLAFLEAHSFRRIGEAMYHGFEIVRYEKVLTTT
jgi:hypothetical protein